MRHDAARYRTMSVWEAFPRGLMPRSTVAGKYETIPAAIRAAHRLGVRLQDESGDLQVVGRVVEGLSAGKRYGATLTPQVHVFAFARGQLGTSAQTTTGGGADKLPAVLEVNSNSRQWTMTAATRESRFKLHRHFSTADRNHIVVHELGHYQQCLAMGRKAFLVVERFSALERALIAKEVGGYAATDPREFIAEVYAAHYSGKTYSRKIEELYQRWGSGLP